MPTLITHGVDDQIVPIGNSAMRSAKLVEGAALTVYPGAPHGLCSTLKDQVNADLLAFLRSLALSGGREARRPGTGGRSPGQGARRGSDCTASAPIARPIAVPTSVELR